MLPLDPTDGQHSKYLSIADALDNSVLGKHVASEDYGRYLAKKDIIDTLIALNPTSAFAAGWIVTLLRAEELGVTTLNKSDFYGGLVPFLQSFGLERLGGASLPDVSVALEGDTLVISIGQGAGFAPRRIEIESYAQLTGLNHLTVSPTGALVEGGNGDDLWIAAAGVGSVFTDVSKHLDTLSNDVLIGNIGADTMQVQHGSPRSAGGCPAAPGGYGRPRGRSRGPSMAPRGLAVGWCRALARPSISRHDAWCWVSPKRARPSLRFPDVMRTK